MADNKDPWIYDLLTEYTAEGPSLTYSDILSRRLIDPENLPTVIQTSPYWLILTINLGMPVSFSRQKMQSAAPITEGAHLRENGFLLISGDCIQLSVDNQKGSHLKNLQATIKYSGIDYLGEVYPGDWIFAWIVNSEESFESLVSRVSKIGTRDAMPCNEFMDGLKFMGRVQGIREQLSVQPDGRKSIVYNLNALGFRELESVLFYDRNLSIKDLEANNMGAWMTRIGLNVQELYAHLYGDEKGIKTGNINILVREFIDIILGRGVSVELNPQLMKESGTDLPPTSLGARAVSESAPYAYLAPRAASCLLNPSEFVNKTLTAIGATPGTYSEETPPQGGYTSYANLLVLLQGLQHYDSPGLIPNPSSESTVFRYTTDQGLLGTFLPVPAELTNKPLWSVLQQFQNPAINDMYTCLKVAADGRIRPTVVFRQMPFTTDSFDPKKLSNQLGEKEEVKVTRFLDLPRWLIRSSMVMAADLGRNDQSRANFCHVFGADSNSANNLSITAQLANNHPIRDDLDIQRSGLRSFMTTVACAAMDLVGRVPTIWMALMADWAFGSQLTLSGTIVSVGIQAPICEGDNLEWDGAVYHIEGVTHDCSISSETGQKTFVTVLKVTNGLSRIRNLGGEYPLYIKVLDNFNNKNPDASNPELIPGITAESSIKDGFVRGDEKDTAKADL